MLIARVRAHSRADSPATSANRRTRRPTGAQDADARRLPGRVIDPLRRGRWRTSPCGRVVTTWARRPPSIATRDPPIAIHCPSGLGSVGKRRQALDTGPRARLKIWPATLRDDCLRPKDERTQPDLVTSVAASGAGARQSPVIGMPVVHHRSAMARLGSTSPIPRPASSAPPRLNRPYHPTTSRRPFHPCVGTSEDRSLFHVKQQHGDQHLDSTQIGHRPRLWHPDGLAITCGPLSRIGLTWPMTAETT